MNGKRNDRRRAAVGGLPALLIPTRTGDFMHSGIDRNVGAQAKYRNVCQRKASSLESGRAQDDGPNNTDILASEEAPQRSAITLLHPPFHDSVVGEAECAEIL